MGDDATSALRSGAARARWRAAEDRLYPALMADPAAYQRTVAATQAVLEELRRRAPDLDALVMAEAAPEKIVAAACPAGSPVPADVLVAAAAAMRDRELAAEQAGRRRTAAVDAAREAGAAWAVLDGPATPAELADGRHVALHLDSGSAVEATVDPWSREEPYGLTVITPDGPADSSVIADREAWLAEYARLRVEVESGRAAQAQAP